MADEMPAGAWEWSLPLALDVIAESRVAGMAMEPSGQLMADGVGTHVANHVRSWSAAPTDMAGEVLLLAATQLSATVVAMKTQGIEIGWDFVLAALGAAGERLVKGEASNG